MEKLKLYLNAFFITKHGNKLYITRYIIIQPSYIRILDNNGRSIRDNVYRIDDVAKFVCLPKN